MEASNGGTAVEETVTVKGWDWDPEVLNSFSTFSSNSCWESGLRRVKRHFSNVFGAFIFLPAAKPTGHRTVRVVVVVVVVVVVGGGLL